MVLERSPTPAHAEKGNEKGRNRNTGSAVDMRFGAGIHAVDMRSGDGDTVLSAEKGNEKGRNRRANYHAEFHAGDKRSGDGKGLSQASAGIMRMRANNHAGFHAGDKRSGEGKGFGSAVDTRSGAGFHAGDKRSGDGKGGSVGNTGPFSQESAGVRQTRAPFSQESAGIMRTRAPFSQESAGIMRTRAPFSQESVDVLRTYASTFQESAGVKWTCAGDPAGSTEYDETGTAYHSDLVRENQELLRQLRAQEARTLNQEQTMQELLSRLARIEAFQGSSQETFQRDGRDSDHRRRTPPQEHHEHDTVIREYVTGREYCNTELRDNDSIILSEIGFGRNNRHEAVPVNRQPYSENLSRSLPRNADSDRDEDNDNGAFMVTVER